MPDTLLMKEDARDDEFQLKVTWPIVLYSNQDFSPAGR